MNEYKTLVLNTDYTPLHYFPLSMISWKLAFKLFFLDRIVVVDYYSKKIRTVKKTYYIPSIVMVKKHVRKPEHVRFTKFNLFLRDDFTCSYCEKNFFYQMDKLTYDHIVPKSKGGKTSWLNITTACHECNTKKGSDITIPKNRPYIPTYYDLLKKRKKYPIVIHDESWLNFIDWPREKVIIQKIIDE